jgi:hypothetical protein
MVALVGPHRTHDSAVRYVAHLVLWWVTKGLVSYGLMVYGAASAVEWSPDRPLWWRSEARRGLHDCERLLRGGG